MCESNLYFPVGYQRQKIHLEGGMWQVGLKKLNFFPLVWVVWKMYVYFRWAWPKNRTLTHPFCCTFGGFSQIFGHFSWKWVALDKAIKSLFHISIVNLKWVHKTLHLLVLTQLSKQSKYFYDVNYHHTQQIKGRFFSIHQPLSFIQMHIHLFISYIGPKPVLFSIGSRNFLMKKVNLMVGLWLNDQNNIVLLQFWSFWTNILQIFSTVQGFDGKTVSNVWKSGTYPQWEW